MIRRIFIPLFVSVFLASAAFADTNFTSSDGERTLTVAESGMVTYHSLNGDLQINVTREGLRIGDFALLATDAQQNGDVVAYRLEVRRGRDVVADDVVADAQMNSAHGERLDDVRKALREFSKTRDGQLLAEAQYFIATVVESQKPERGQGGRQRIGAEWSGWGCAGNVLNAVAAGAAMVGGCGTPACGTAYKWCCGSGVAWYGSALIQIATSDSCVFTG